MLHDKPDRLTCYDCGCGVTQDGTVPGTADGNTTVTADDTVGGSSSFPHCLVPLAAIPW